MSASWAFFWAATGADFGALLILGIDMWRRRTRRGRNSDAPCARQDRR